MTIDLATFEADREKVNNGVWKDIGIAGIWVMFRSPHSPEFLKTKRRIEARYAEEMRKGKLTPEQQQEIFFDSVIEGGIIDWKNVVYEGKAVPWSIANGKRFLSPIYFRKVSDAVFNTFMETDQFLRHYESEGQENLSVVLNGTVPTASMKRA